MSCIFKDPSGKIVLMCKGADAVIKERLAKASIESNTFKETQDKVDKFAEQGLRTLFLAEKVIEPEFYKRWNEENKAAKLEINNRDEKVAAVDEKIETEMTLVGSTAIEDRLQDEVAQTIQFMKKVGIKVWVLTGDKIETAMNIGVSAGLLDSNMDQHIIEESSLTDLKQKMEEIKSDVRNRKERFSQAIIVAGASLLLID
jgi:magnesium-transporting ATPase (P-type)